MNLIGIIVGAAVFVIIGLCHPVVIKLEYYHGRKSWVVMLVFGLIFTAISLFMKDDIWSTILGAAAFSCFWGIHEIIQQEQRVVKGWFPENPARHEYYESLRKKQQPKTA